MTKYLSLITLLVNDYNEAIDFYVNKLGFYLLEDTFLNDTKRWVVVSPDKYGQCSILLAKAVGAMQKNSIGNQTGGRVFLFLKTGNFEDDYLNLIKHKVKIVRQPKIEKYGKILVFEDLYGNLWDLIEDQI